MSDAITVSAPISGTDRTLTFETGKLAQLADGAVVGRIGDTVLLATATAARSVREGADFFPLTVDIEERAYAAGKIPGSFFRREGKSSDQAILTCRLIDRPLRPSFPKGFRNEVHIVGHHLRRRPGQPPRRPGHQRRLGRPDDLGHPLRGPDRGGPGGLLHRRPVDPAPHLRGGRRVDLRAGGGRPGPDRRRRRRDRHHDGRGRRLRALVPVLRGGCPPGHRGGAGRRPRGRQDVDPRVDRAPAPAGRGLRGRPRPGRDHRVLDASPTTATTCGSGSQAVGTDAVAAANTIVRQGRAQRRPRRGHRRIIIETLAGRVPRAGRRDQGGRAGPDQEAGPQADRGGGPPHRRPDHHRDPAALGRGRPVPDGPRLGPLPAGRDPGAQRDHPGHAPDEPAARHHHPGRSQALHAPLQLPALLHRRDRVHARARSAGRSATACWPSGPCCRSSPTRRTSPTPCAWSPTCWPPTARRRWPRCAARPCR